MTLKKKSFFQYDAAYPVIDCEEFISSFADAKWTDDSVDVDALRGFTAETMREDVVAAVRNGILNPRGRDMLLLKNGISPRSPFDPFNDVFFEREEFEAFACKKWLVMKETAGVQRALPPHAAADAEQLRIGPNKKILVKVYVENRARAIYAAGEASTKDGIAAAIANELEAGGYQGERGGYLSAATVVKAIPSGLTGGRAKNGRKTK